MTVSGLNSTNPKREEIAVIDIGSNSVRLVIYQTFGAHFTPVFNEKIHAGLGRDLKATGRLSEKGRHACLQALLRFVRITKARSISKLQIAATAALRTAEDAPEFLADINKRTGLNIEPISGEEEARLSAMGLIASDYRHRGVAADLGGASLEIMAVDKGEVGQSISLPLGPFEKVGGSLRQINLADFKHLANEIDKSLQMLPKALKKSDKLYLIGGAWRNLASVHQQRTLYPMRTLQDYEIDATAALSLASWAYGDGALQLLDWAGLRKTRAETLPYSGLMLERLLILIKPKSVIISPAGLREGMVYDALPESSRMRDALFDGCRDFGSGALQAEDFADPLYNFISPLRDELPWAFRNDASNQRMAKAACLLAGLGKNLHPTYRPELVFNDVLYAPVAGLTHKERAFLALTLFRSYAHKRDTPNNSAIETLLNEEQQDIASILGETMRLGIVATGRSPELLGAFKLKHTQGHLTLSVLSSESALITDQVIFRLERLAGLLGFAAIVDTHS